MPSGFGGIQREELGFKEENKENAPILMISRPLNMKVKLTRHRPRMRTVDAGSYKFLMEERHASSAPRAPPWLYGGVVVALLCGRRVLEDWMKSGSPGLSTVG